MAEKVVGKVVATTQAPATVNEFSFWIANGRAADVEIGHIVVAGNEDSRVFGLVTEIRFYTDADSPLSDYYSHEFGRPDCVPPTARQEIHIATAEVLGSSPLAIRPTTGGMVRLAEANEVLEAYGMDAITDPVLCGVIPNGRDPSRMAPALLSKKFLLGPEGAHANFSGASGLATKTSAAVSLILGILSAAKKDASQVAVVAFNVKSADLLSLERNADNALLEAVRQTSDHEGRRMLEIYDQWKVDLAFKDVTIRYFAPGKPFDPERPNTLRQSGVRPFYYSLKEVADPSVPVRLADVLDPADLDDKSIGVLATIEEKLESGEWGREVSTFKELIEKLPTGHTTWEGHHAATVAKVRRLLQTNLKEILSGLFTWDKERGAEIPVETISGGEVWVIDIQVVNDKGKRIVFANVLERLAKLLEQARARGRVGQGGLDSVVIFVDELNKFAPAAQEGSARLREQIIEIAARGRSIGLVLLGAEQFASAVHREIVGNVSTQIVGRTEQLELGERPYRWIGKDLQYLVSTLPKGKLLARHALFGRPAFIRFPRPLYTYDPEEATAIIEKATEPPARPSGNAENEFDALRGKLKGRAGIHPTLLWEAIPKLRQMGVSQSTLVEWFRSWVSKSDYAGATAKEREAFDLVLKHKF
jgi:hypothetical protein